MKLLTFIFLMLCLSIGTNAQTSILKTDKEVYEYEEWDNDFIFKIKVSSTFNTLQNITVSAKNSGSASHGAGKDYELLTTGLQLANQDDSKTIEIKIKADEFDESDEFDMIEIKSDQAAIKPIEVKILIKSKKEKEKTADERYVDKHADISVYTGGNFDFFEKTTVSNIAGELVLSFRDLVGRQSKGDNKRWGINLGFGTFKYFTQDTSSSSKNIVYQLLDTTKTVRFDTSKFVVLERAVASKRSVTNWIYYAEPTYRLNKTWNPNVNFYIGLHFSTIRSTVTVSDSFRTIYADTFKLTRQNIPSVLQLRPSSGYSNTYVSTNGYFGLSFPTYLHFEKILDIYLNPVFGVAQFRKGTQIDGNGIGVIASNNPKYSFDETWKGFYLIRGRFTENLTKLNVTVGGEIRGFFPTFAPLINLYVGAKISFPDYFGDKKK